jgi:hypothetical protein
MQLKKPHQRVLEKYVKHSDVTCVLCITSSLSGAPRLLPIGPGLEYESTEDAMAKFGNSTSDILLVDVDAERGRTRNGESGAFDRGSQPSSHVVKKERNFGDRGESTTGVRPDSVAELKIRLERAESKIRDLEYLDELRTALEEHESNLNSREREITKMEDELMARMNSYMERIALVEQREDNVADREVRQKIS